MVVGPVRSAGRCFAVPRRRVAPAPCPWNRRPGGAYSGRRPAPAPRRPAPRPLRFASQAGAIPTGGDLLPMGRAAEIERLAVGGWRNSRSSGLRSLVVQSVRGGAGRPGRDRRRAVTRDRATGVRRSRTIPSGPVRAPAARTIAPMRLLEREPQLGALAEWASDADRAAAASSSSLVRPASASPPWSRPSRERRPEARWLVGACDGLFTPRPLAPVIDIAEVVGGELARLAHTPGTAREQLFTAVLRELGANPRLGVLVVEDVHWADRATLDLLHFLSRRLREARVLVRRDLPRRRRHRSRCGPAPPPRRPRHPQHDPPAHGAHP